MARIDSRMLPAEDEQRINENFCRVLDLVDDDAEDITDIQKDITALFALAKVSVTFDSDGGSTVDPQLIPYDSAATEPVDPTKEDYTFTGWTLDGEAFDFSTKLKEDTELVATWAAEDDSEQ